MSQKAKILQVCPSTLWLDKMIIWENCSLIKSILPEHFLFLQPEKEMGPMCTYSIIHLSSSVDNPLLHSWEVLQPNASHIKTVIVKQKAMN